MKKIVGTVVAVCALMLAGCVNNDPFGTANDPDTITIGSQDYYSNEIIAEIYAQALEKRHQRQAAGGCVRGTHHRYTRRAAGIEAIPRHRSGRLHSDQGVFR